MKNTAEQSEPEEFHHFILDENVRLELLDCINIHRMNKSSNGKSVITRSDGLEGEAEEVYDIQNNSIVKGELELFSSEWLKEDFIVGNTLLKIIKQWSNTYSEETHIPKLLSAWYSIMRSGDFQLLHDHIGKSGSQVSGAVYLDVPHNLPEPQGNINWIMSDARTVTSSSPKTGDIFLWPSRLLHTVYPFSSDEERIMISFNGRVE
jgi:hypothetical protein